MFSPDNDSLGEILADSRIGEHLVQVDARTTSRTSIAKLAGRTTGGAGAARVPIR